MFKAACKRFLRKLCNSFFPVQPLVRHVEELNQPSHGPFVALSTGKSDSKEKCEQETKDWAEKQPGSRVYRQ